MTANPYAILHLTTAQLLHQGRLDPITWTTAEYDTDEFWQSPTHPERWKVGTAGIYLAFYDIEFEANKDATRRFGALRVNGVSDLFHRAGVPAVKSTTLPTDIGNGGFVHLNVNDFLEVVARQDGTSELDIVSATFEALLIFADA